MTKKFVPLSVQESTRDIVRVECIKAFLEDNPSMEGINITDDTIVTKMAKYWLTRGGRIRWD